MDQLGLFAKFWNPGNVKTRLASALDHEVAARVYFECLEYLVEQLDTVGDRRSLVFSPSSKANEFRLLAGSRWKPVPQCEGNLGNRLNHFFRSLASSETGPNNVIVIGSDSPTLAPTQIESGFRALKTNDVVLGPTTDGGYYLIGLRLKKESPMFADGRWKFADLFAGIEWSTDRVFEQTCRQIDALGLFCHLLPEENDIDDLNDLRQLMVRLKSRPEGHEALLIRLQQALAAHRLITASHVPSSRENR